MKTFFNNTKQYISKKYKLILLLLCIFLFIFILLNVINRDIKIIDEEGYYYISHYLINNTITPIAIFFTFLGEKTFLIALAVILIIFSFIFKRKNYGIQIAINLPLAALVNFIIKSIVRRPRPTEYRIIDQSGYSFPSGHSMVSMAFYGFLIYLVFKHIKNKYIKIPIIILLVAIIPCVGISRIYLGVHYTSDVLAGFLLGLAYLIIFTSVIKKFIRK